MTVVMLIDIDYRTNKVYRKFTSFKDVKMTASELRESSKRF